MDSHWEEMDKLYNDFESLETLQIDLQLRDSLPETLRNKRVKEISSLLPLLRARENFVLSFTVNEEPVPWDSSEPLEGVATEEPIVAEEGDRDNGTLDHSLEPIDFNW